MCQYWTAVMMDTLITVFVEDLKQKTTTGADETERPINVWVGVGKGRRDCSGNGSRVVGGRIMSRQRESRWEVGESLGNVSRGGSEPVERRALMGAEHSGELVTDGSEDMDCGAVQAVEGVGGMSCANTHVPLTMVNRREIPQACLSNKLSKLTLATFDEDERTYESKKVVTNGGGNVSLAKRESFVHSSRSRVVQFE
uniref:Uncharacterized protein n=1 Tax=Timema shepardi TaxID=629360 RepID=A0A7R9FYR7_TIMSH|nr:unnamed protein product [Timema shepardi]